MSRGIGGLQRAILTAVRESPFLLSSEMLRWKLYEKHEGGVIPPDEKLPAAWNTSFARALKNLGCEGRGVLQVETRKLRNMEECVIHYPGKTLQTSLRELRLVLLPALQELVDEGGVQPSFDERENEEYFAKQFAIDEMKSFKEKWILLAKELRQYLVSEDSEDLFLLLCRGRFLFVDKEIQTSRSFSELLIKCCDGKLISKKISEKLHDFHGEFISLQSLESLRLKSYVHQFAYIRKKEQWSLRKRTLENLHRLRRDYVEALPGFKDAKKFDGLEYMMIPGGVEYPGILHRLFDQTVFQDYNFLSIASK